MSADELSIKITARDELRAKVKDAEAQLKRLNNEATELNKNISTPEGRRAWDQHATAMVQTARHLQSLKAELGRTQRAINDMGNAGVRESGRWRSALDQVQSRLDRLHTAAGPKINSALRIAAGGFAAVAGASVVMGVKTLGSLEQSEIAFGNLLGSQEKAKVLMDDLANLSAATPFELPQLTDASQKLLGYGFKLKDLSGTLTTIGDAAAGTGSGATGIDSITRALGQMQAKSKISTEDLNQLAEVGIPVWDILSQKMGLSKKAAMEFIATPGGAAKAFSQLNGVSGILDGLRGRYAGMMEDQSQSLNGMMSTLKDTAQIGLADALRPYMGDIKNVVGQLTTGLGPALAQVADSAAQAAPTVRSIFGWLADNWQPLLKVTGALIAMYAALRGAELVIRGVGVVTKGWAAVSGTAQGALGLLRVATGKQAAETKLQTAAVKLARGAQLAWSKAIQGAQMGKHALDVGKAAAAAKLSAFWAKAAGAATKIWSGITKIATGAQRALSAAMAANPIGVVVLAIVALIAIVVICYKRFTWFRKIVDGVWRWIKNVTASFVNWFQESAWPIIKKVIGFVVGYYKMLWNVAKILWNGTLRVVKAFVGWFSDSAWPVIQRIGRGIGKTWDTLKDGARIAWDAIKRAVMTPIEAIQKAVKTLKEWLGGLFDGVASAAKTAADAVKSAWDGLTGWLPGRWMGGDVQAGWRGWVGELGPELFVPRIGSPQLVGAGGPEVRTFAQSGTVIPHHLVPMVRERERVEREVREHSGPLVSIGAINATGSAADMEDAVRRATLRAARMMAERR